MQMIKKNMVALAVAGALVSPLAVMADDAEVSGFIDVIGNSDSQPVFTANAEVDVSKKVGAVTVRVDFDANLATNGGTNANNVLEGTTNANEGQDSGRLEQAFFAWAATEQVTVLGGLFNSPVGQELEDSPNINFGSHSALWEILDDQTALYGNNLAGVAAVIETGPAKVTLAVVDDLGLATSGTTNKKGKTSTALVVNMAPMAGLDLELGYVTQDDQKGTTTPTAGNVLDFNAAFKTGAVTLGLDYLAAENLVDSASTFWARYDITDKVAVKARYELVAFEETGIDDSTRTTLYTSYAVEKNLSVALQWSDSDTDVARVGNFGIMNDSVTLLNIIGKF